MITLTRCQPRDFLINKEAVILKMLSLKYTVLLGLLVIIAVDSVSSFDLFSTMDFARDTMMKHSDVKPLKSLTIDRRAKSGFSGPSRTNSYSNKFLQALNVIERGIADARATRRVSRNSSQKLRLIKSSIQEAIKNRRYQFARHQLGRAFFLINENVNSSSSKRRKRATMNAASMFVTDLKKSLPPARFREFMALEGEVTLAFAIDTTGSMSDEIATAKQIAVDVIKIPRNNPVDYILSPFGDPEMGPVTFRNSSENASFVNDINRLNANGGGDCPERTFSGIMDAIEKGPCPGSPLYVFTDASAKDNDLVDDVIDLAMNLDIRIFFFLTGGPCIPGDDNFSKVAEATSGQVLRFKNAKEMLKMSDYIGKSLAGFNIISTASKIRPKKKRTLANKTYTFPIDESVETMLICFTTETKNSGQGVVLTDPKGIVVTSQKVSLSMASVYKIQAPKIGTWSIQMSPSAGIDTFDVISTSESIIDFSYYFLVTVKRRRSKFEVFTSSPIIGKSSKLIITVVGADKINRQTVRLELITRQNQRVRDVNLTPNGTRGIHYTATFAPPSRPFKLKIKGTTTNGNPLERISHNILEPKSVLLGMFYCKTENTIRRGGVSTTVFRLHNAAHVDKAIVIKVRDKQGFARPIRRASRKIRRGRTGYFSVSFRAPTNATVGTTDTATVIVSVNNGEEKLIETIQLIVIS